MPNYNQFVASYFICEAKIDSNSLKHINGSNNNFFIKNKRWKWYNICFGKYAPDIMYKRESLAIFGRNMIFSLVLTAVYKWLGVFRLYIINFDLLILYYFCKIMA